MEGRAETSVKVNEEQCGETVSSPEQMSSDTRNPEMALEATNTPVPEKRLSKKQARKQRKEQQKLLRRKEKRAREKMRKKAKRAAQREAGCVPPKRLRKSQMENSNCKQRIAVDMSFEKLMRPKDVRHLFVQLAHAYAVNRRAKNPLQFSVVGFSGPQNKFFDNPNNHHWDVIFEERPLESVFEKDEIVYLTADSENSLQTLDSSKVYVIGGLLDHNSLKGHCLKLATEKGYAHARLPIAEYITLQTRKVLTVNQVFEILLRYTENQSWKTSFLDVIPRRKGIVDSGNSCTADNNDNNDVDENLDNNDNVDEHNVVSTNADDTIKQQLHELNDHRKDDNDKITLSSEQIGPEILSMNSL